MNGGKLVIEVETNTKKFDAQIEETRHKIEQLEETAKILKLHVDVGDNKEQLYKINTEIEKLKNNLVDLYDKQKGKNDGFGFKAGLKDLKKFALGLIGVRGLYSLVRKASSTWLSQDEELAKKFQNIWLGLGAALKPILEWLAEVLNKLLGYINVFVKAFTNNRVDLIATANAQAIKKQANAMKELKNQSYGFDELNIQQTNNASSSLASGKIGNIELDPGIEKFVTDLGSHLGNLWGTLEDIIKWCNDHLGVGGTIAIGLAAVIGVKALVGGSGLLGVLAVLLAIIEAINLINELRGINKPVEEGQKKTQEKVAPVVETAVENSNKNTALTLSSNIKESVQAAEDLTKKMAKYNLGDEIAGSLSRRKATLATEKTMIKENVKGLIELAKKGQLNDDVYKSAMESLKQYYSVLEYEINETEKNTLKRQPELRKELEEFQRLINQLSSVKAYPKYSLEYDDPKYNSLNEETGDIKNNLMTLDETKACPKVELEDNDISKNLDGITNKVDYLDGKTVTINIKENITAEDKSKAVIDAATKNLNNFAKKFGISLTTNALAGGNPFLIGLGGLADFLSFAFDPKKIFGATGGVMNRCASGTIINNPGRGVYLGNNTYGGEAGKEGLIPLTDPNAMTELGETIGRYITVNVTNVTKLDSKVIGRETKRVNNDMEFLRNGGGV